MVTDLYFIRHGEAVSNVEPVIAGVRGNRGLTECGRQQAALLEERLRMSTGGAASQRSEDTRSRWRGAKRRLERVRRVLTESRDGPCPTRLDG